MVYSQGPHFEYFPIDENHPCLPDEPYGLSKMYVSSTIFLFVFDIHGGIPRSIGEMQADTIVRRFPSVRIASLRLHWSIPTRATAQNQDPARAKNDLWGWVQEDSAAEAFLLAITQ